MTNRKEKSMAISKTSVALADSRDETRYEKRRVECRQDKDSAPPLPRMRKAPRQAVVPPDAVAAAGGGAAAGNASICLIRKLFSSMNWSSSVRSSRKVGRKRRRRSRLLISMRWTAYDLFGFATKTWGSGVSAVSVLHRARASMGGSVP